MSKSKSAAVTALVGFMTIMIVVFLYGMHHRAFMALMCIFAAIGFAASCGGFFAWLGKGNAIEPVSVKTLPVIKAEPVRTEETVEDIIREMRGETGEAADE